MTPKTLGLGSFLYKTQKNIFLKHHLGRYIYNIWFYLHVYIFFRFIFLIKVTLLLSCCLLYDNTLINQSRNYFVCLCAGFDISSIELFIGLHLLEKICLFSSPYLYFYLNFNIGNTPCQYVFKKYCFLNF